jgi:lysophospholipase L1-like esterase
MNFDGSPGLSFPIRRELGHPDPGSDMRPAHAAIERSTARRARAGKRPSSPVCLWVPGARRSRSGAIFAFLIRYAFAAAWAVAVPKAAHASPPSATLAEAPADIPADAVTGARELVPFFGALRSGRVDVIGIGDSNQLLGGHGWDHGWDHGWNFALASGPGLYATGLHSAGENAGNSAGVGYRSATISTLGTGLFSYVAAAPQRDLLSFAPGATPISPLVVPAGSSVSTAINLGLQIEASHPIGTNGRLRFHSVVACWPGSTAIVQPAVRLGQAPWTTLSTLSPLQLSGPSGTVARSWVEIPAAARNAALNFRWTPWGAANIDGPFMALYMRAESADTAVGASFHTLYGTGGMSARDIAEHLRSTPIQTLSLFLAEASRLQSRGVLVRINTGLNDRNETLPSVDAGITPGNSEAAFEDNLRAIIARVKQAWDAAALPADQLYFLLTVSHPVATPDEQLLMQYRDAADRIASGTPSIASIRMDRLTTSGEMLASGWYQSGGSDRNHLTQAAYEVLASREWSTLKAVVERTCPADMNRDLDTDMLDFLAFFNCFDTADIAADMDADGIVDFLDFLAFFNSYDQGC